MPTLIPAEYWEYSIRDVLRGLAAALGTDVAVDEVLIPGVGGCIPVRSARSAIVVAIKALGLRPGARIGVPLYNCPVVLKAVKAAGCTPYFIDIEPDTFCMSVDDLSAKCSKLDAVIAVHMFGNLCDMPRLIKAARGKPVIEDCAQSLGSRIDGRMAGLFGDMATFSFRSGKYLSVGEGGALYIGRAELRSIAADIMNSMPVSGRMEECTHIAKTYIRTRLRTRPLYGLVGYPLWKLYNKKAEFSAKSRLVQSRIYRSDLAITTHRLQSVAATIERQRANADYYSRTLELPPEMLCGEKPGTFYNRYLYPITFSSTGERDYVADYLHYFNIGTIKPYQDIPEVASRYFGYTGDCPITEDLSKRLLVIPSYHGLKKAELRRIAIYVNKVWARISGSAGVASVKSAQPTVPPSGAHGALIPDD